MTEQLGAFKQHAQAPPKAFNRPCAQRWTPHVITPASSPAKPRPQVSPPRAKPRATSCKPWRASCKAQAMS